MLVILRNNMKKSIKGLDIQKDEFDLKSEIKAQTISLMIIQQSNIQTLNKK